MNHGWREGFSIGPTGASSIDVIARLWERQKELEEKLTEYRDMLMRLYQDMVPPGWRCHRCGLWAGAHDETCAMAEVEELLGLTFDGEEDDDEWVDV